MSDQKSLRKLKYQVVRVSLQSLNDAQAPSIFELHLQLIDCCDSVLTEENQVKSFQSNYQLSIYLQSWGLVV